jgi:hypothetical protein
VEWVIVPSGSITLPSSRLLPQHLNDFAMRTTLVAAANAYLDAFLEGKMDLVPWGLPCHRTEGGAHTGRGAADDSCQVGVPSGAVAQRLNPISIQTANAVVIGALEW